MVQGSNGEYVSLSYQEKIDMVQFVSENNPEKKLILAGSGCEGKYVWWKNKKLYAGTGFKRLRRCGWLKRVKESY